MKLTLTGADNKVDPNNLVELANIHPFEVGILIHPSKMGMPRYPTLEWIRDTVRLLNKNGVECSAHLCRDAAKQFVQDQYAPLGVPITEWGFSRIQLNIVAREYHRDQIARAITNCGLPVITQDNPNNVSLRGIPSDNHQVLFDASGGRGVLPETWPRQLPTKYCGYAGGLTPKNLGENNKKIRVHAKNYWLDIESGVRTNNEFDLSLAAAALQADLC